MEEKYNKIKIKAKLFEKYLYHLESLKALNKKIFDSTELFENKKMSDYDWEQFNYFKKKIGKYGRDINVLRALSEDEILIEINTIRAKKLF